MTSQPFVFISCKKSSGGGGGGGGRGKQQRCGDSCGGGGKQKFEQDPHNWIVEQREEQWSNIHDLSDKKSVHQN